MSERKPNDLRYLRKGSLEQERKIFENYFHDLIYNYGVDSVYFRQDIQYPEKLDVTPTLSGMEDLIYGENSNVSYYLSGNMVIYIEVENDIFELNKWSLQPNENISIYFTVGDFNTKFATQLGTKKEFSDTIQFSGEYDNTQSCEITAPFLADGVLSGYIKTTIPSGSSGTIPISSFDIDVNTEEGYKIPINEYIAKPNSYVVSGGDYMGASYGTINVATSSYTGSAQVGVLYYGPVSPNLYNTNIMPQVGDFFRMTFFDGAYEEYEISNIADRIITTDGINPLLGKYIWKCQANRRAPSFEDVIGETQMEDTANAEIQNLNSYAIEEIANSIDDYASGEDKVYGGYSDSDDYLISSEIDVDNYVVSGVIFVFDYGPSYLLCDGLNLYFRDETGITTLLSNNERVTTTVPDDIVGLKYIRTDGDDLFFVNNNTESWKLTSVFKENDYLINIQDLSTVVPLDDKFSTNGIFCILDKGFVLFSDGNNLFAINNNMESTQLTIN